MAKDKLVKVAKTVKTAFESEKLREQMRKIVALQQRDFEAVSIGKPGPSFLSHVKVRLGESFVPISTVAQLSSKDSQNIIVHLLDAKHLKDVQTSIDAAKLGVVCQPQGASLIVPIPKITGEYRESIVKGLSKQLEAYRIQLRKLRTDAINAAKEDYAKDCAASISRIVEAEYEDAMKLLDRDFETKKNAISK